MFARAHGCSRTASVIETKGMRVECEIGATPARQPRTICGRARQGHQAVRVRACMRIDAGACLPAARVRVEAPVYIRSAARVV